MRADTVQAWAKIKNAVVRGRAQEHGRAQEFRGRAWVQEEHHDCDKRRH